MPEFKHPSNWEDATVAFALVVIAVASIATIVVGPKVSKPDADLIDAVVKCAGGVVVLLGAYFTARTLKQSRADHRIARMLEAIKMTADDEPPVWLGGILILGELARTSERTRGEKRQADVVRAVLGDLANRDDERGRVARRVVGELPAPPEHR